MRNKNSVQILGHVGNDPEVKTLPSGNTVAEFSVATSYQKRDGSKETTWHRVKAWNKTAEAVGRFVRKGHPIMVEGRLRTVEFEREGPGGRLELFRTVEIVATDCYFLNRERGE